MKLILASASPRRSELMQQVGWSFEVMPVDVKEDLARDLPLAEAIAGLALRKARACPSDKGLVIGADTVVVLDDKVLGKPASAAEAQGMLQALSGRRHKVITGVAVVNAETGEEFAEAEETSVWFRDLNQQEIEAYIRSGEPMDKAGAYGIQGKGALLVTALEGCYFNVVGLPLVRLARLLKLAGFEYVYRF